MTQSTEKDEEDCGPIEPKKLEFNLQIDMRSGKIFGRHQASESNESSDDIATNIFKSIKSLSTKEQEIAHEISEAARLGDHDEAVRKFLSDETVAALMFCRGHALLKAAIQIDSNAIEEKRKLDLQKNHQSGFKGREACGRLQRNQTAYLSAKRVRRTVASFASKHVGSRRS